MTGSNDSMNSNVGVPSMLEFVHGLTLQSHNSDVLVGGGDANSDRHFTERRKEEDILETPRKEPSALKQIGSSLPTTPSHTGKMKSSLSRVEIEDDKLPKLTSALALRKGPEAARGKMDQSPSHAASSSVLPRV